MADDNEKGRRVAGEDTLPAPSDITPSPDNAYVNKMAEIRASIQQAPPGSKVVIHDPNGDKVIEHEVPRNEGRRDEIVRDPYAAYPYVAPHTWGGSPGTFPIGNPLASPIPNAPIGGAPAASPIPTAIPPIGLQNVGGAGVPAVPPAPSGFSIGGQPISPSAIAMVNNQAQPNVALETSPLNPQQLARNQIISKEGQKYLDATEAENLSKGQADIARINAEAAAQQQNQIDSSRFNMRQAMDDASKRDDQLRKMISAAQARQIDPEQWWNNKSTAGKIEAGIGVILGGIGGGLQRTGRNPALEQINLAIGRDIASQQENINNNWKGIADRHELDDSAFNRELHAQEWENNYRKAGLEVVKQRLASAAATTTSQTVKNNALLAIQQLSDEQDNIRNKQWMLGQQALGASQAQMRKLAESANKDYQDLIKEKGVDPADALFRVYTSPYYRPLIGAGMAPTMITNRIAAENAANVEKQRIKKNLMSFWGESEDDADKHAEDIVRSNPKYSDAFRSLPSGPVVPDVEAQQRAIQQAQANQEKQTELTVQIPKLDKDGNPIRDSSGAIQFSTGQATNTEAKTNFERRTLAATSMLDDINKIKNITQGNLISPNITLSPTDRANVARLLGDMQNKYVEMQGFTRAPGSTEVGTPTGQPGASPVPKLSEGWNATTGMWAPGFDQQLDQVGEMARRTLKDSNTYLRPGGGAPVPGKEGKSAPGYLPGFVPTKPAPGK